MNTQQYAAWVGEMEGRTPLSALNAPVHEPRARQQRRRGGNIALLIREGSSARGYLMRCRCERRLTQIEWDMGGNNATDYEECPQIYAV